MSCTIHGDINNIFLKTSSFSHKKLAFTSCSVSGKTIMDWGEVFDTSFYVTPLILKELAVLTAVQISPARVVLAYTL